MKFWYRFWFTYPTYKIDSNIDINSLVHHINRAECHEEKLK